MSATERRSDEFAAAFDAALARLCARIERACAGERKPPARVVLCVRAAFGFAAEHPRDAGLLTGEALAHGEVGQDRYRRMIARFAALLHSTRASGRDGSHRAAIGEEAIVGGIAMLIGQRLAHGREDELPAAAADAAELILIPWVGLDAAHRLAAGSGTLRL
jgi:hypothetical protein